MSAPKPPAKTQTTPAENPARPFCPEIEGELRKRVTKYAKERGRSMSNAVRWAVGQFLKQEGF
jgi:hypothetical protein